MKVTRRDFLKTMGLVSAGTLFFNPALGAFTKTGASGSVKDVGTWFPSTCQGCTTWCPIEVLVQNGRAVKVRGNQNSMTNPGTCCHRGHMIPQMMYDPDRLKVPMKRTNTVKGKGIDPEFVPITWDEALTTIAEKMMELRNNEETHKFLLMRGRYSYNRDLIYSALPKIFGSPNNISHSSICAEAEKSGRYFLDGKWDYRDFDMENCKYMVFWGVDPFRSNRQLPRAMQRWSELRKNASIAVVDPTLTTAASKADKWLPVKPGEDGALASALAHEILVQGLWNKEFVGDFNDGINQFTAAQSIDEADFTETETAGLIKWWNIELHNKTPEWAAPLCGIDAQSIRDLASGLGAEAPNVAIWTGPGPLMTTRGSYAGMGIHALNGLLGAIESEGGIYQFASLSVNGIPALDDYIDATAATGVDNQKIDQRGYLEFPAFKGKSGGGVVVNNVPNAMLANDPYDIKVAIGYWCNFSYSGTQPQRWYDALSALPFFAHITTHASEMSQFADIILPAAFAPTEKMAYLKTGNNLYKEVTIQQPLAERVFDVKADETEIMWLLAKKLDELGFSNLYDYYSNEFADVDTDLLPTNEEEFGLYTTKYFTQPAWSAMGYTWDEFLQKGVANTHGQAQPHAHWGSFGTPSNKFEFYSDTLKNLLQEHADKHATTIDDVLEVCKYEARGELAFVPHYEAPFRWGSTEEYPLTFIDVKSKFNREGRSQNTPGYYQFKKLDPGDNNHEDCIKLNPQDAQQYGISDGDEVKVSSPTGSIVCIARVYEGVMPGTVAKTFGQGHWAYGRFASKDYANFEARGGNNNYLLPDEYDRLSGSTARNGGFVGVKVEKNV